MGQLFTNDALDEKIINGETNNTIGADSVLFNATVGLCSVGLTWGRGVTLAQVLAAEPGYSGYARKAVTWNAASRDVAGNIQALGTVPEFRPTNGNTPAIIQGIFVLSSSSTLLANGPLDDAPVALTDQFSNVIVTLAWKPTSGGLVTDLP
jgi:hypothetical protein